MDSLTELERRIATKEAAGLTAAARLWDLTGALLDGPDSARPALLAEHTALLAEKAVLADELTELTRRWRLASAAPYELVEREATASVGILSETAVVARLALNAAMGEHGHWMNIRDASVTKAQHDAAEAAWAGNLATLRSQSQSAAGAVKTAAYARDAAVKALALARQRLGIG